MKTLINFLSLCLGVTIVLFATSCSQAPKGAMAIQSFDKTKYLGKWYEDLISNMSAISIIPLPIIV
jgi:lipocalin